MHRRAFLVTVAASATGLALGFSFRVRRPRGAFLTNLWVRIDHDGLVHLTIHKSEMGQGVLTALSMMIAEELGASWEMVRVHQADGDFRFPSQNTSGSESVSGSWIPLRTAGATARHMLATAAAGRWGVPPEECDARDHHVVHAGTGRRLAFGELAHDAARIPVPDQSAVRLRRPADFRLIGRPVRRVDARARITGRHVYGIDVAIAGMLYATVVRSPVIGGTIASVNDAAARAVPGVRRALRLAADGPTRLPERVAVVAENT